MAIIRSGHIVPMVALVCVSCTTVPPFVPFQGRAAGAVGPKIASVETGLKCGLWQAANNTEVLTYYDDGYYGNGTGLLERTAGLEHKDATDPRAFTLKNLFGEIEYIAEYQLTLDVVDTGAFNPIIAFSRPYSGVIGDLPATSVLGSVGRLAQRSSAPIYHIVSICGLQPLGGGATARRPAEPGSWLGD